MEPQLNAIPAPRPFYSSPSEIYSDESPDVIQRLLSRSESRIAELIELDNMSAHLKLIHLQNIESMITAATRQSNDQTHLTRAQIVLMCCEEVRNRLQLR
ncbi:hypothetical protein IQ22_01984 [Pseudomonas duriflava]|uniref:Uncharacterized protein n=1 Tax=Pseudomonas duriflava TaxID=459528 RepID=A0A562QE93_9PSED|nr:hypothetical protein [Pseudomonas duriflava]TWI55072.1 hypothetical protein IQ22_01984 [Pseudomonas duriflava]